MSPRIELVTTGSELLNGSVANTHAQWLGAQLHHVGWILVRDTTVSDSLDDIHDALCAALSRVDAVIVSGGLGPTGDDRTRDAAARWIGREIVMHEPTRQRVIEKYAHIGKPLNRTVERHALVVDGAEVLDNDHGLAAGQCLEKGGKYVFLLPGPPSEFRGVMIDHVLPRLDTMVEKDGGFVHVFQTAGIGESNIASMLEEARIPLSDLDVAYCAKPGNVAMRITSLSGDIDAFDRAVDAIRACLGSVIYAETDEPIEVILGKILKRAGKTMAAAESCTGGMIGSRLTAVPGSSGYFLGGVVAYSNDVKEQMLGVDAALLESHGAVSAEVAEAMARGVRERCGADVGIAVTGTAGPDGGTDEKPVGLVCFGLADANGVIHEKRQLGGNRETVRSAASVMAMDLVRRRLTRPGE